VEWAKRVTNNFRGKGGERSRRREKPDCKTKAHVGKRSVRISGKWFRGGGARSNGR